MRASVRVGRGKTIELRDDVLDPYAAPVADEHTPPARLAYAAAHVVLHDAYVDSRHALDRPGSTDEIEAAIDWDATRDVRRFLARQGFGIAEAMDTAQRFFLGWPIAKRLIEECGASCSATGFIAGAGVDHLTEIRDGRDLARGVLEQSEVIRRSGGAVIVLPLPWLSRNRCPAEQYVDVYRDIIENSSGELFIHWLGELFLPDLEGYFPGDSFQRIMALDPARVRGAKLSLLDPEREVRIRQELAEREQIVLTGDDFHFTHLIRGGDPWSDEQEVHPAVKSVEIGGRPIPLGDFSHALLGILDATAVPAGLALRWLASGDVRRYQALMGPCEELSRWVFRHPTRHYKAGLAFLAWLDGRQSNAFLVNHEERAREAKSFLRTAELASRAGLLRDAERSALRLEEFLRTAGLS